jgi:hypothetical protein
MAKGQQRSNREAKKPKKDKPKSAGPASRVPTVSRADAQPKGDSRKR